MNDALEQQIDEVSTSNVTVVDDESWAKQTSEAINKPEMHNMGKDYCQLKCRMIQRRITLIYPHGLREQNPELLRYLSQFAEQNKLKLLQDRRVIPVEPLYECRKEEPPILALGVGVLLQQTGLTGTNQLHLSDEDPIPQVSGNRFRKLLKIADTVSETGKKVTVKHNRFLAPDADPAAKIHATASKVVKGNDHRIFSYFNGKKFRAIGYTQKSNFVFHVFAGGGTAGKTGVWGPLDIMTREPIHFRLYRDVDADNNFGLLYTSYNLDMHQTADAAADWNNQAPPVLHKKVS